MKTRKPAATTIRIGVNAVSDSRGSSRNDDLVAHGDVLQFGRLFEGRRGAAGRRLLRSKAELFPRTFLHVSSSNGMVRVWCEFGAISRRKKGRKGRMRFFKRSFRGFAAKRSRSVSQDLQSWDPMGGGVDENLYREV